MAPLLPKQYWESPSGSLVLDGAVRKPKRESNYTEVDGIQWLDSKPRGSVLYVSFGSETGHAMEYPELASALEDSTHPFIWFIQSGSAKLVIGLIIRGWAPQLLIVILIDGRVLSYCGWNSAVEAIGQGVPILAWPMRVDQIYKANLVVNHLKIGYMAFGEGSSHVVRKDIFHERPINLQGSRGGSGVGFRRVPRLHWMLLGILLTTKPLNLE
ncbi:UDP-glycosyltransferase 73B4-like [Actinidia eriantha]|uniref:UDP-glycosyltransferase 73B4-like n=1 Tax=Actinidia eriantha TaxID=165200 RepID=UPI00258F697B|nr:UDP-glycosyltransferase 73B4-like [Actinidia eriantha]